MVGVSLALQLGAVLPQDIQFCWLRVFHCPKLRRWRPEYHPSFDARSTALSYSSRLIYENMRVWEELQQWLCAIEQHSRVQPRSLWQHPVAGG